MVFGDELGKVFCIVEFSEGDGVDCFAEPVDCLPFAYASHVGHLFLVCLWYTGHTTHKAAAVKPWCRRWRLKRLKAPPEKNFFLCKKIFWRLGALLQWALSYNEKTHKQTSQFGSLFACSMAESRFCRFKMG